MIEERLLTIDELAELLRINRRSVYRLIENHTIDFAIKIGGSWRFLPADFNAWLERNKPQQTTH
ncbi:MAG: helix-turn-helix domain-containing protein [Candidatus Melainabacteria bacterium]|nr:helix-turn-helix domain-containing protein [Candidatus Melainabacteria bacterium]